MQRLRLALRHPMAGATLRYGIAGATVGGFYLALPVVLNTGFGVPLQVVIPIAYVLAVSLHFTLQRYFVFRHVERFALSGRQQAARYVAIGAVQYPTTAIATALLPHVLGVPARAAFVCTTLTISLVFFLVLRGHVFNPADEQAAASVGASPAVADRGRSNAAPSAAHDDVIRASLIGQSHRRSPELQQDPVPPPMQPDRLY